MITSDRGFIIATPTKCGTTTLEEMTRRHGGGRVSRGGVEVPSFRIDRSQSPRRQHSMVPPPGWEGAQRYMMVRNPFTRYMSQYEYLRAPHNYSKFGAREIQGVDWGGWARGKKGSRTRPMDFQEFLNFIADMREAYGDRRWTKRRGPLDTHAAWRSPWIWLDPLDKQMNALDAAPGDGGGTVTTIPLEHFWAGMAFLREYWDIPTLSVKPTIRANRSLTYGGRTPEDYWGFGCVRGVWRGKEWDVSRVQGGDCGCAACRVGVVREAKVMGYFRGPGVGRLQGA